MKWFFKWMYNGLQAIDLENREERIFNESPVPARIRSRNMVTKAGSIDSSISLQQSPLTFRIYPATGGHIVEYTFYNEKTDRNDQALHLIHSDCDLGQELAKIMTLEALKR